MKFLKLVQIILLLMAGMALISTLVSCFDSSAEKPAPAPIISQDPGGGSSPGVAFNGKIYYQQNCASCHAAGADDTTTAFGAIDLAKQDAQIQADISQKDTVYNTMGRFNNIDQERVDDLKKYLSGI